MKRGGFWTHIGGRHVELERVDPGWTEPEYSEAIGRIHARLLDFDALDLTQMTEYDWGVVDGLHEAINVLKRDKEET